MGAQFELSSRTDTMALFYLSLNPQVFESFFSIEVELDLSFYQS